MKRAFFLFLIIEKIFIGTFLYQDYCGGGNIWTNNSSKIISIVRRLFVPGNLAYTMSTFEKDASNKKKEKNINNTYLASESWRGFLRTVGFGGHNQIDDHFFLFEMFSCFPLCDEFYNLLISIIFSLIVDRAYCSHPIILIFEYLLC